MVVNIQVFLAESGHVPIVSVLGSMDITQTPLIEIITTRWILFMENVKYVMTAKLIFLGVIVPSVMGELT